MDEADGKVTVRAPEDVSQKITVEVVAERVSAEDVDATPITASRSFRALPLRLGPSSAANEQLREHEIACVSESFLPGACSWSSLVALCRTRCWTTLVVEPERWLFSK
jgi:hypothetical protein